MMAKFGERRAEVEKQIKEVLEFQTVFRGGVARLAISNTLGRDRNSF